MLLRLLTAGFGTTRTFRNVRYPVAIGTTLLNVSFFVSDPSETSAA